MDSNADGPLGDRTLPSPCHRPIPCCQENVCARTKKPKVIDYTPPSSRVLTCACLQLQHVPLVVKLCILMQARLYLEQVSKYHSHAEQTRGESPNQRRPRSKFCFY